MVDIYVGKDGARKHFHIHKGILCSKIPYFDKMFNSGFQESLSSKAELPEDNAEAFDYLEAWIYSGSLTEFKWNVDKGSSGRGSNYPTFSFYILLDKLCLGHLLDEFVSSYIKADKEKNYFPACHQITLAYRLLPEDCKFLQYFLLSFRYILVEMPRSGPVEDVWSTKNMTDTMESSSTLRADLLTACLEAPRGRKTKDPRKLPPCTFHEHSNDDDCPLKGKK